MKKLIFISTILAVGLSACLKDDKRNLDFADAGNIVNMPLSGLANFGLDAVTSDTAVIKFGVDYATATPNKAITVTLGIDPTVVATYNAANPNGIQYDVMPASAYSFTQTTVNIAAGAQFAYSSITIYKNTLDPSKSYMLPLVIKSAGGIAISSNFSTHYYHVIGNDFAGAYTYDFHRYAGADSTGALNGLSKDGLTAIFTPVSPTEFTVYTNYDSPPPALRYDVTFVKAGPDSYNTFAVSFVASDLATIGAAGVNITKGPVFLSIKPASNTTSATVNYTKATAQAHLFRFAFTKQTSAQGYIIDYYHVP